MDDRRDRPLSDEWLDREIARVLDAEPSPSFVARTRARVAAGRMRATGDLRWPVAAGAVVAVVVLVSAALRQEVASRQAVRETRVSVDLAPAPELPGEPVASPMAREESRPMPRAAAEAQAVPPSREPPVSPRPLVVISQAEVRGFDLLVRQAGEGIPLPEEPADEQPVRDLVIPPIDIAPLAVEPLAEIAWLDGGQT